MKVMSFKFELPEESFNIKKEFDTWIADISQQIAYNIDEQFAKFLEDNGYEIRRPFVIDDWIKVKEDLESKGKFLDYIGDYVIEETEKGFKGISYIVPFFNNINNPLSENDKQILLQEYISNKKRDKNYDKNK